MSHRYAAPWKGSKAYLPHQTQDDPTKGPAKADAQPTVSRELRGVRNWTESVGGIPADRIRDCIVYQLDVKRDQWWTKNATRAYVRRNVQKLVDDTPEDYRWSPNPLWGQFTVNLGDGETHTGKRLLRDPETPEERRELRECDPRMAWTPKHLAKKSCKRCGGSGYVEVLTYPGHPLWGRLTETHVCGCCGE